MYKYALFLMVFFSGIMFGQTLYVSTTGSDSNAGTIDAPLATPQAAMAKLSSDGSGAMIWVRGGTYKTSTQLKTSKNGVSGNLNKMWAYPGEKPVFDFTGLNDRGIYLSKNYWHFKGIEECNAGSNGICISSSGYNIIEGCVAHDNGLEGIKLTGTNAHDNLILNCDSYRNYDAVNHGEDADGFAAKTGTGTGNVFRGCRAWNNSDDGWDFYSNSTGGLTLDSCWSFRNGINIWGDGSWAGDGDGFKLGGAGTTAEHYLTNCLSFDNSLSGFAQNHSIAGQTMINCTAYRNNQNTFSFYEAATGGTLLHHVLKNCISYGGNGVSLYSTTVQVTNSWQQAFSLSDADFSGVDTAGVTGPRNADYSLPKLAFMHLSSTSKAIDKGTDVGLPYYGAAPDLGAYEYYPTTDVKDNLQHSKGFVLGQNYPNPFNPSTVIRYQVPSNGSVELKVYDVLGKEVATLVNGIQSAGVYTCQFSAVNLPSGLYIYTLKAGSNIQTKKMLLLK
jgi:parallel beta-helix repeat protein